MHEDQAIKTAEAAKRVTEYLRVRAGYQGLTERIHGFNDGTDLLYSDLVTLVDASLAAPSAIKTADEREAYESWLYGMDNAQDDAFGASKEKGWLGWQARASLAAERVPEPAALTGELQRQCSEWGAYWRAPDAHGVELTKPQAIELLETALRVEVEIKDSGCIVCDGTGAIDGQPCPDCTPAALPAEVTDAQILFLYNKHEEKLDNGSTLFHFEDFAREVLSLATPIAAQPAAAAPSQAETNFGERCAPTLAQHNGVKTHDRRTEERSSGTGEEGTSSREATRGDAACAGSVERGTGPRDAETQRGELTGAKPTPCQNGVSAPEPAAQAAAVPAFITAMIDARRQRYALDQSCTPEFLHWLDTMTPREGVGANEAWNAGVAWAKAAPAVSDEQIAALRTRHGVTSNGRGLKEFTQVAAFARAILTLATPPAATQVPSDEDFLKVIDERDRLHEVADDLAAQIAAITGEELGEHSSANDPWRNALLAADDFIAAQLRKLLSGRTPAPPASVEAREAVIEEIAQEFDRRAAPKSGGFYEPDEPAQIIRALAAQKGQP